MLFERTNHWQNGILLAAAFTAVGSTAYATSPVSIELGPPSTPMLAAGFAPLVNVQLNETSRAFEKGARYWSLTAGQSRDPDLGRIYLTQLSIDHYVADEFALRIGLTLGYADAKRTDGGIQGGPEAGLRWHFFTHERFSTYFDGSVAAVVHQHPMTEDSLHFNFDLQAGVGATFQLGQDTHLQGGVRWHHLSNARIRGKSRNLGYDGPMLYLGLMRSF